METTTISKDIEFYLHGELHAVKANDVPPTTSLCDYLRDHMGLTGTKPMCREGGCGSCIVAATYHHPVTGAETTMAINSCLVSIFSCTGWKISTVEGIKQGKTPHPIQTTLYKENGTQCGYCTPGMVMNMYALVKEKKANLSAKEIENSFGGNICRCTGYRPIVTAMKKFATATDDDDFEMVNDIEDMPCTEKCLPKCLEKCHIFDSPLYYESDADLKWYKAFNVAQIMSIQKKFPKNIVRIVAGNTAQGVYRDMTEGEVCIDVNAVKELKTHQLNNNELIVGANVTLTDFIKICNDSAKSNSFFKYLTKFAVHVDLVAHVPVRNIGTLAGNLMIKHKHREFPSDIFLLLESVGATVTIMDTNQDTKVITVRAFLDYDMNKRIITKISLPALDSSYVYETYKIMTRSQNTHALLNAAFLMKMEGQTVKKATIVYGNVSPKFIHALKSETYLVNRPLFTNSTLKSLFETLNAEVNPQAALPEPSPEFRRKLAISLFYKFVLSIAPSAPANFKSGGQKLIREVSESKQDWTEHKEMYPLNKSVNKLEGLAQTTGEAEYIIDIPDFHHQLFGAFVLVKYPAGSEILAVNADKAKKIKGVVDFVTVADIAGDNSYIPSEYFGASDPIFCDKTVAYFNQPIGLIVAKSRELAERAAKLVEIEAKVAAKSPVTKVREAIKDPSRVTEALHIEPTVPAGTDIKHTVTGEFTFGEQYHYHMETQCCIVVPRESEEYDMYPATQWIDVTQMSAAKCMNIPMNKINVVVRRLGGAYGGKISRNGLVSCAALIAAVKLKKPIKIFMTLEDNMNAIGKRNPIHGTYTAKVNDDGVIQSLQAVINTGVGHNHSAAEYPVPMTEQLIKSAYNFDHFDVTFNYVKTDIPANTWTRSPGSVEGHASIETIIEHIAYAIGKDPYDVRMNNLNLKQHQLLKTFMENTLSWAQVEKRKKDVEQFNKENRWRKKGISVLPTAYNLVFEGSQSAMVSIFGDGSVAISHAGIEMGQGINTKTTQFVAKMFGIDIEMVSVKPSNSFVSPNAYVTGGSITGESICFALRECCQNLLSAMNYQVTENSNEKWVEAVGAAVTAKTNLTSTYFWSTEAPKDNYYIYGVVVTEVEYDALTGNHIIRQVDLLEDTGYSMSPYIDLGQVEGAFVMGIGYWTTESIVYDKNGELMTNRTWTYKPPGLKDIPERFNVKFPDEPNELSPFKTKATGEPPFLLAFSVALALRQAIKSAKYDSGLRNQDLWTPIDETSSVVQNYMNAIGNYSQFTI